MDSRLDTGSGVDDRERHIQQVVSTLKTLADSTEGNPRQAIERLGAKLVVQGVQKLKAENAAKEASRPRSAIAIMARAEREFGPQIGYFEPETLADAGFSAYEVAAIQACKTVLHRHTPFERYQAFAAVAAIFNQRDLADCELLDYEVAWAVDCMRYLDPVTPFSPEVACFVAAVLHYCGHVTCPKGLAFAEEALATLNTGAGNSAAREVKEGKATPRADVQRSKIELVDHYVLIAHQELLRELKKVQVN